MQQELHDIVLQAVREAYGLQQDQVEDNLTVGGNQRVFGSLVIKGSDTFNQDSVLDRSRKVWRRLRDLAGPEATNVGVVVLRSAPEG
jgi:hypothetical protein